MKQKLGFVLISVSLMIKIIIYYFINNAKQINILSFSAVILAITGFILVIPFHLIPNYIIDNNEWASNKDVRELIKKIRLRALLFNNISVIIFILTIAVIISGFYFLVPASNIPANNDASVVISIRIGASILLVFLIQILFNVFKYILRVAAFYNGKADALEFFIMKPELPIDTLMTLFTPDKYDITDLRQTSFSDIIKKKVVE